MVKVGKAEINDDDGELNIQVRIHGRMIHITINPEIGNVTVYDSKSKLELGTDKKCFTSLWVNF